MTVPSIKDVAKIAGVSTATVSRTLAGPGKVAATTRDKVMAAVAQTGYVTNIMARNLRRRQTNTVVVMVPDIANPFYAHIIQGIERVAHRHHYRILLGDIQDDPERQRSYTNLVMQKQADGIISLARDLPFALQSGQREADPNWPPLAMACEYYGEVSVPLVRIDNCLAAHDAVDHLLQLGHRCIAYIDGPVAYPICAERRRGYEDALRAARVNADRSLQVAGDFSPHSGVAAMNRLLALPTRPTAVFCASDEMAIGAIKAIKAAGLGVPKDLSVVGFDDIGFAEFCDPPLTTIHQPRGLIGETLMQLMLATLAGTALQPREIILPHRLVRRGSTAAP